MPAVAVRRGRLVLFIFIRFKGYLDDIFRPKIQGTDIVEFDVRDKFRTVGVEMQFIDTIGTVM